MIDFRSAIFPLLAAIALACAESESPPKTPLEVPEALWVEIAGEPFELELALDAATRYQGLSGRLAIEPNGGMLFVNTVERPQAMVMRDCAIPIDVAFLDFSGEVVAIHEMRPELPHRPGESPKRVRIAVAGCTRAVPPRGSRLKPPEAGWTKLAFRWAIAWFSTSRARWISPATWRVRGAERRAGGDRRESSRFGFRRLKRDAPAAWPRISKWGINPTRSHDFRAVEPVRIDVFLPAAGPGGWERGHQGVVADPAESTRSIEISMSNVSPASPRRVRQTLNVGEIVKEIGPDFESSRIIYWSDLLASAFVGWSALIISARVPFGSLLHVVATLVAIFAVLRAALFIHELSHLKRGRIPGFEPVWNLIVGIPFMIPSLVYVGSHMDHHKPMGFGTTDDPEYAQIARWSRLRIVTFVFTVALPSHRSSGAMGCTRPALPALPAASAIRGRQTVDARDQCQLRPPDAQG